LPCLAGFYFLDDPSGGDLDRIWEFKARGGVEGGAVDQIGATVLVCRSPLPTVMGAGQASAIDIACIALSAVDKHSLPLTALG
jgi:hypothetical protein